MAAFLLDSAAVSGLTVVPLFVVTQLRGGAGMSGAIGGLHGAAYTVVSLICARLMSQAPKGVHSVAGGILGFACLFCLAPLTWNPYLYGAVSSLGFGCVALVWPAMWAWIGSDPDPERRSRSIGLYNISWSAGVAIGPLLAGWLYAIDYRLAFFAIFILALSALLIELTVPHRKRSAVASEGTVMPQPAPYDRESEVRLHAAWLANFFGWTMFGAARSVYVKRLDILVDTDAVALLFGPLGDNAFPLTFAAAFTYLIFAASFARAAVFLLMGRFTFWRYWFTPFAAAQVLAACGLWWLAHTHSFVVMAGCFLLMGAVNGACFVASIEYSLANIGQKRGRAAAHEATVGGGNFVGAMGCGLLAVRLGVVWPFIYMPVFALIAVVAQWLLIVWRRRAV